MSHITAALGDDPNGQHRWDMSVNHTTRWPKFVSGIGSTKLFGSYFCAIMKSHVIVDVCLSVLSFCGMMIVPDDAFIPRNCNYGPLITVAV